MAPWRKCRRRGLPARIWRGRVRRARRDFCCLFFRKNGINFGGISSKTRRTATRSYQPILLRRPMRSIPTAEKRCDARDVLTVRHPIGTNLRGGRSSDSTRRYPVWSVSLRSSSVPIASRNRVRCSILSPYILIKSQRGAKGREIDRQRQEVTPPLGHPPRLAGGWDRVDPRQAGQSRRVDRSRAVPRKNIDSKVVCVDRLSASTSRSKRPCSTRQASATEVGKMRIAGQDGRWTPPCRRDSTATRVRSLGWWARGFRSNAHLTATSYFAAR